MVAGTLVLLVLVDGSLRAQSPPAHDSGQTEFLRTTMRLENLGSVTPNARRYDVNPDWTLLAAPKDDGTVLLFDPSSGRPLAPLEGGFKVGTRTYSWSDFSPGSYFGFSADGRFLVWQWGKKVVVWDVPAREIVLRRELEGLLGNGTVRVSPDGHLLAWSTSRGLTLWDVARGTAEDLPAKDVHAFSPDGRLLALATVPPQSWVEFRDAIPIRKAIWDVGLKGPRGTYEGLSLGFSPDGRFLLTTVWGGMPGGIRIWEVGKSTPRVLSPMSGRTLRRGAPKGDSSRCSTRTSTPRSGTCRPSLRRDAPCPPYARRAAAGIGAGA
jgi:WD40 repeat protein